MSAREVARLHGVGRSETVRVERLDDDRFGLLAEDSDAGAYVPTTAEALAQLVCDLGAHVGPVADEMSDVHPRGASWSAAGANVFTGAGRVMATTFSGTPQVARRLALTLLVAAAVAEQHAGEAS